MIEAEWVYLALFAALLRACLSRLIPNSPFLSPFDAFLAAMDNNTIIAVVELKTRMSPVQFYNFFGSKIACHRRFRQRVVKRLFLWQYWEDDTKFHLKNHTRLVKPMATEQDLQTFVSDLQNVDFPATGQHSPWCAYFIEEYGTDRSAFVFRVHHAVVDGVGMMQLFVAGMDDPTVLNLPTPAHLSRPPFYKRVLSGVSGFAATLFEMLTAKTDGVSHLKPRRDVDRTLLAWSDPISLPMLKAIARKWECSVNDVMMAAVTMSLASFTSKAGRMPVRPENPFTAVFFVSLRSPQIPEDLSKCIGNQIGSAIAPLPVFETHAKACVKATQAVTTRLKHSFQPVVSRAVMQCLGLLPPFLIVPAARLCCSKTSVSVSNVPGPQKEVMIEGVPVKTLMAFTRPQMNVLTFCLLLSYNGSVRFGLSVDAGIVPQPRELVQLFEESVRRMGADAGVD